MKSKLNTKLHNAFLDSNYNKMNKLLIKGADPTMNDNQLYKYASSNDDIELFKLLIKYNKTCILTDKDIINCLCAFNSIHCIKYLNNIMVLSMCKGNATYEVINKICYE